MRRLTTAPGPAGHRIREGVKTAGGAVFGLARQRLRAAGVALQAYPCRPLVLLALALVLAIGLLRLYGFVIHFSRLSLQMDFSAFYTAGQALDHGVSPYLTNIPLRIWDGVDGYLHSRFLYPPLAAVVFEPLALLPYFAAKIIWMVFSLCSLGVGIVAVLAYVPPRWRLEVGLAAGSAAAFFFPLLTLLERGQMDAVTLGLLALGIRLLGGGGRSRVGAGLLFALATLLKLNIGFVFPYLLLRRNWRAAAGYAAGGVLLLGLSLAINGPHALSDYIHHEMPRIAQSGEGGGPQLSASELRVLQGGSIGSGRTDKDGRLYPTAAFGFSSNATLVRLSVVARRFPKVHGASALSVRLLEVSFVPMIALELWLALRRVRLSPPEVLIYWNAVLLIVLLTGPFSWVMNVVWMVLIPVAIVALGCRLRSPWQGLPLAVAAIGFLWAAAPDSGAMALLNPFPHRHAQLLTGDLKYVLAEVVTFAGLWLTLVLAGAGGRLPPDPGRPAAEPTAG